MVSIGIDIGSFSIKVAAVRATQRGYEVIKLDEYPLSQDPNKDRTLEIIEAMRDLHSRYGDAEVSYVTGAHQDRVSIRRRNFPFRERHKIYKSLPFELEDDIPLALENSVYDFRTSFYVGNQAHVLAVAASKDYLRTLLTQYDNANIPLNIVSVEGLALSNVFETWRDAPIEYNAKDRDLPEAQLSDVIIYLGHTHSLVLVIQDGFLLDVRSIEWGGKELAELIASKYSLHYVEALKELRKKAFVLTNNEGATREQVALSEIIKSGIDRLAHEVQLVLMELKSTHNIEYRQALTAGGVSLVRNLGPYLTQKLEIPTNRLSSLELMPQLNFASSPNNEISYLTAIGYALEGIRRPKNPPLNLLKGDFAKQSEVFRMAWDKYRVAVHTLTAIFVIALVWGFLRDGFALDMQMAASDKLRSLSRTILPNKSTRESDVKSFIRDQERKVQLKQVFENLSEINSPLDLLKRVSQAAPAKLGAESGGLNVSTFTVNNENVFIAGDARSNEVVTRLLNSLKGVAMNGTVVSENQLPNARAGYTPFAYSFRMARRAGGK
jgi:general secretion pathway protein L